MEVSKPLWLAHAAGAGGRKSGQTSSVFSIALDSTGERIATGGLDCTVRIWHTSALISTVEGTRNNPTLAAVMSRHTGAVLCVRWSPPTLAQSLLASSSDDSVVLVWRRIEGEFGNATFEAVAMAGSVTPTEGYNVLHRLTGHESDVNGLEWSSDGKFLASCGLDGRVHVWDVLNGFTLLRRLESEGRIPLKGLLWDPLGQFLGAQANNGTLFIWRTTDWKVEIMIASPYSEVVESYTYFSRPAWSPDGNVICIPDAINESDTVALLVERKRWNCEQSLVGHSSSVQVAKFSPRMYTNNDGGLLKGTDDDNVKSQNFLVVALGSQDGCVSIWSSNAAKPVAVITGLFEHAVMDLAWEKNGTTLLAASYDGTVAKVTLETKVIGGVPISEDEQVDMIGKLEKQHPGALNLPTSIGQVILREKLEALMKGRGEESITNNISKSTNDSSIQPEVSELLVGPPSSMKDEEKQVENSVKKSPTKSTEPMAARAAQQIPKMISQVESRLKNGKRRITPQLLQTVSSTNEMATRAESYTVLIGRSSRKNWLKVTAPKGIISLPIQKATISNVNTDDGPQDSIEIINTTNCSKISRIRGARVLWEERVESLIPCATVTMDGMLLYALTTNKIIVVSPAGRRILPPIILSGQPVQIACADDICCTVLDNGLFYIWRLPNFTAIVNDELPPQGLGIELISIELHHLTGSGDVVVEFCFGNDTRIVYSHQRRAFFESEGTMKTDIILEAIWGNNPSVFDVNLIPQILRANTLELRNRTLAHIESQIAACHLVGDQVRLIPWLCAYAQRLAIDEDVGRVTELLQLVQSYGLDMLSIRETLASCLLTSPSPMVRRLADSLNVTLS